MEQRALKQQADALGITLELGTRGLDTAHLQMASLLEAKVIRSICFTATHRLQHAEAQHLIARMLPRL